MDSVSQLIKDFGFPIVAAVGMGYFIYFIWKCVTETIEPVISDATGTLIGLIDRIRMLDNDLIRLNQKLNVVLTLKEQQDINEDKIAELREIIKEAGLKTEDIEKTYSIDDLKKVYKEEKDKQQ